MDASRRRTVKRATRAESRLAIEATKKVRTRPVPHPFLLPNSTTSK